jgi:hypothetical protein
VEKFITGSFGNLKFPNNFYYTGLSKGAFGACSASVSAVFPAENSTMADVER